MANYIGVQCPVCQQRFADGDDIVVCPICGTPHHRACYQQLGKCAVNDLHTQGHTFTPPPGATDAPSGAAAAGEAACVTCGAKNPAHCIFCQTCGARLNGLGAPVRQQTPGVGHAANTPPTINAYTMAFGGLSPTEELDGVSVRDLAIFVGPNAQYFLPQFKSILQKSAVSFNIPAMLFSFFYFFYRKMNLLGGLMLGLMLLSQAPMLLIMPEFFEFFAAHFKDILLGIDVLSLFHPQNHLWVYKISGFIQYIPFVLSVAFSVFANRLYLTHSVKNVKKIKQKCEQASGGFSDHDYGLQLAKRGRTNVLVAILVLAALVVGYFALSYHFLLPYQDALTTAFSQVMGGA